MDNLNNNFERVILIRYGEIFLKGNNRGFFESCLISNIKHALKGLDFNFDKSQNRYIIDNYAPDDEIEIIERLKKVFGIHSVSPALRVVNDLLIISSAAVYLTKDKFGKFRVTVNRADKRIAKKSMEIAADIGGDILDSNANLKVDLFKFDIELFIDIRENGYSYLFTDKIMGSQGMPVGCAGTGMLLLSGGIDSPVAGYMMAKRGMKIHAIHFHSAPYTSEMAKEKVIDLAKLLKGYCNTIVLHIIPFTDTQLAIHEHCAPELMITIMRRFMMKISEKIAKNDKAGALITGESLGQVASQTMQSITITNSVIEDLPVFRPLIGLDKTEIMDIARKIGTYDTSILPYEDCCTIFLPKNPAIRPKMEAVEKSEVHLNVDALINDAIARQEIVII